ncbi:MAG: LPS export ABC transporter permease LptG [Gammaproteobacteria bacterium]|nr:MAG: LPS export ABC transporter permease LptG [Gammaproteobacteria bacterium]
MIKKLDRHLIAHIVGSTLVVLFALMSIDLLGQIIAEVDDVGKQDFTFGHLMMYVFGILPMRITMFFPMALLIGALMGLGKLAATSELTVMQVAGVSRLRIGVIGFFIALVLGSLVVVMTEYVGVPINEYVQQMRAEALRQVSKNRGRAGIWAQDANHFVNIGGVNAKGELANIRLFIVDDEMKISRIQYAATAVPDQGAWTLKNITSKTILPTHIQVKKIKQKVWENQLDNSILDLLLADPNDLSIRDLYRYIRYQEANEVRATTYALEFWQRLFIPLSTGVMFLLALPFVFGSQRQTSQGRKLFVGVLLGLMYYVSYTSIANIILLTGAPVVLGAIIPIALFALVSFGLLALRG